MLITKMIKEKTDHPEVFDEITAFYTECSERLTTIADKYFKDVFNNEHGLSEKRRNQKTLSQKKQKLILEIIQMTNFDETISVLVCHEHVFLCNV